MLYYIYQRKDGCRAKNSLLESDHGVIEVNIKIIENGELIKVEI